MKVVINVCFGGFGLSPEATLKLYERGVQSIATPVDEYWPLADREESMSKWPLMAYETCLKKWRDYLATPGQSSRARRRRSDSRSQTPDRFKEQ